MCEPRLAEARSRSPACPEICGRGTWPGSCTTSCRPAARRMRGSCWVRRVTPSAQPATPMPTSPSPSPRRCWTTRAAASVPRWRGSRRSIGDGPSLNEPVRELLASRLWTDLLAALDRYDEALRLSTDGLAAGQRDHQGWAVREWEGGRGCRLLQVGRLGEAAAVLDGVVAAMEKATPASSLDVQAAVASARVAMHTGNEPQIRKCAAIARALLETGARLGQCAGAWLLALIALGEGDAAAARAHLCALGETERLTIVPLNPMDVADEVPLARIAMAAGDGELAASAVATARERLRLNPAVASIAGTAAHAEGLVTGDADHLAVAIKCFGKGPRPLALASALEDAGKVLAGRGDREEGIAMLGQALELYHCAGASWDAARVRQRLRALGVR